MLHLSRALDYYLSVHLISTLFFRDIQGNVYNLRHSDNTIDVQRQHRTLNSIGRPPGSHGCENGKANVIYLISYGESMENVGNASAV